MATCARTIDEQFSKFNTSCWPFLYIRNFLLGWSVHIPPHIDVFSVITTSSWRIFTVMKFMTYFVYLLLIQIVSDVLLWTLIYGQSKAGRPARTYSSYVMIRDVTLKTCQRRWMIGRHGVRGSGISVLAARHDDDDDDFSLVSLWLHEWYFMAIWLPTSDDLFCSLTLSCWPILYMTTFFKAYSVHIPPLFTYILYVPPLHDLICTVVNFMANFIYFFLVGFSLHIFWLHVHVLLVTYAVHIPPIGTYSVHTEVF